MIRNPSELRFAIAPGQQFLPSVKNLKERLENQKTELLRSPLMNKSSCNHCIEKRMNKETSDRVSMIIATDATSCLETLSKSKSRNFSQSEFLSVDQQEHLERELIKQLHDPEAIKNGQLKQMKKLIRKCE
jgi:hypothetical protein